MGAVLTGERGFFSGGPFIDAFWNAVRFRPLVERKTDISVFTAMLNTGKIKENA